MADIPNAPLLDKPQSDPTIAAAPVNPSPAPKPDFNPARGVTPNAATLAQSQKKLQGREQDNIDVAINSAKQAWLAPFAGLEALDNITSPTPQPSSMHDFINHLQQQQDMIPTDNEAERWVAQQVGSIAGFLTNPISLIGGEVGSVVADKGITSLLGVLPEATSAIAKVGTGIAESGAKGTGAMLGATELATINDAYDEEKNKINVPVLFKGTLVNGAVGFGFGAVHGAYVKVKGILEENKIDINNPDKIDSAVKKGVITQQEADFFRAAKENPNDEKLAEPAKSIMESKGIKDIDATGTVNVSLLSAQDMENIQNVLPYEIVSHTSGEDLKPKISEYIVKNALDKATSSDALMDTLHDLVSDHEANIQRLKLKIDKHLKASKVIRDLYKSDKMIRESVERYPVSEHKLYEAEVRGENHGMYVPKKIREKAEIAKKIQALSGKSTEGKKGILKYISQLQAKHDEINIKPLADEARELYKKMDSIKDGSHEYQRIMDMAKHDVPLAKTMANVLEARRQLKLNQDYAVVARVLIDYSKYKGNETPKEKITDLINHARDIIEQKLIDDTNKEYVAAVEKLDAQTNVLSDEDMKALGEKAAEEDEEFGGDIKKSVEMYEQVKKSAKLLSDYIKCMGGISS